MDGRREDNPGKIKNMNQEKKWKTMATKVGMWGGGEEGPEGKQVE